MGLLKSILIGAIVTGCLALVVGTQGSSGGPLAVYPINIEGQRLYWSWPVFLSGTGLTWALILLQK